MFGIGLEWVHLKQGGRWTNALAGEVAGDFMFWPTGKHRFGWYLEPAYDYNFAGGHQKSLGISFGLLIGIRLKLVFVETFDGRRTLGVPDILAGQGLHLREGWGCRKVFQVE